MIRWKSFKNVVRAYALSSFAFTDDTLILTYLRFKKRRIPLAEIEKIIIVNTGSEPPEGEASPPREIHSIGAIITEQGAIPIRLREDGDFLRQADQHDILIQAVTKKRRANPDPQSGKA